MDKEQREEFMEELYAKETADQAAKELLRQHMEAAGVEWDGEV